MMYPFMTLDDHTEIVHSEMKADGSVKVYMERPDEKLCFCHASCYLPSYQWEDVAGFTSEEIAHFQEVIESTAHLILQFSQEGGLENAAIFKAGKKAGKCYLCHNRSRIPERVLRNIMNVIEARSSEVIEKWIGYFGSADFYC